MPTFLAPLAPSMRPPVGTYILCAASYLQGTRVRLPASQVISAKKGRDDGCTLAFLPL